MKLRELNFDQIPPLSTYPERRTMLLALCSKVEKSWDHEDAACALADCVRGILEDEAILEKEIVSSSDHSKDELEAMEWRSVIDEPATGSALARFFDDELGEWVYTVFREGPVRCTMAAPYSEWLSLDVFNRTTKSTS